MLDIASALRAKQVLSFEYDGKQRIVEPHAYGRNSKGDYILRGYQVDGESSTSARAWKLFSVAKIEDLEIANDLESEAPREGYKMGDRQMAEILAELEEAA